MCEKICIWLGHSEILGQIISSAGTAMDPEKITRMAKWPVSLNK